MSVLAEMIHYCYIIHSKSITFNLIKKLKYFFYNILTFNDYSFKKND